MVFDQGAASSRGDAIEPTATYARAAGLPKSRPGMSAAAVPAEPDESQGVPKRQRDLQACVSMLLAPASGAVPVEKRAHRRFPFRRPIGVTPINNGTGRPDRLKSFSAFGIDISTSGICFLGRQLVPARKAMLSLEGPDGNTVYILFEPRWVRFTRGGWYQTGGRLLEVLPPDREAPPHLRLLEAPPDIDELCENSRHPRGKTL